MAEVKKARLFLRRGTDTDRKLTTLCEGELGYSTDAFRVVIGDGSTAGGRSVGATTFVSAGVDFNTDLSVASGAGIALSGDLAVFPSSNYTNAGGGTSSIDSTHATTVMILTGSDPATASHWVNVNNNIPFGNVSISADDISGDQIHGGDISGNVTFSGQLSTTASTVISAAGDVHVAELVGTGVRSVVATATGQLSTVAPDATTELASNATGMPVAMCTFGQDPSTLKYSLNVTSVAVSGSNVPATISDLNSHIDIAGASEYPIGSDVVYTQNSQGGTGSSKLGGIYEITFTTGLGAGYTDRTVVVSALNYRGDNPDTSKRQDDAVPVIDYTFLSATKLLIVFSAAEFNDSDRKNQGGLRNLYPSSGVESTLTRFTVQVY